jgi:hypothetical protein
VYIALAWKIGVSINLYMRMGMVYWKKHLLIKREESSAWCKLLFISKQTYLEMKGVNLGYSEYINNYYDSKI